MSRSKDFGGDDNTEEVEPLDFKLHGETFDCVPEIQGSVLLNLVKDSQDPDPATSAAIILSFFEKVLQDESYTRFETLINSKDKIVRVEKLGEITGWLVEEYTNRGEGQPEAS